jgi:lysophospholipase L1-like esterase
LTNALQTKKLSHSQKIFFPLIAILISLLFLATILEIGLRVAGYSPGNVNYLSSFHEFDEKVGHRGRKNFVGRFKRPEFDTSIIHNSSGFRRQEFLTTQKENSCKRTIHVFGDSFVWGWGVDQGEGFTDLLNKAMPDTCVRNYGIISTGTVAQYVLFDTEVKKNIKPGDLVLLMFYSNDFDDNVWKGKVRGDVTNGTVTILNEEKPFNTLKDRIERASYLFNYLSYKVNLYQLVRKLKKTDEDHARQGTFAPSDKRYVIARHFMEAFNRDTQASGARFITAYIATQAEMNETATNKPNMRANADRFHKAFLDISASLGVESVDLLPKLQEYKKMAGNIKLTFKVDEHWNPAGHKAAAQIIENYILKHP